MTISVIPKYGSQKKPTIKKFFEENPIGLTGSKYEKIIYFEDGQGIRSMLLFTIPNKRMSKSSNQLILDSYPIEVLEIFSKYPRCGDGTKIMLKLFEIALVERRSIVLYCSELNTEGEPFFQSLGFQKNCDIMNFKMNFSEIPKWINIIKTKKGLY